MVHGGRPAVGGKGVKDGLPNRDLLKVRRRPQEAVASSSRMRAALEDPG